MAVTVQSLLESKGFYEQIKGFAKMHGTGIPDVICAMVEHVLTSDDSADLVSDLLSDSPKRSRGRKPLSDEERTTRAAARAVKGTDPETSIKALQAAIDQLRKA